MNRFALAAIILASVLAVPVPTALADDHPSKEFRKGQAFCPSRALVVGSVLVQPGRCYVLAVLRNGRGTFLAFLHPSAHMSAHERINLASDEGHRVMAKVIYLVPIQATGLSAVVVPVNSVQLVQIREEDRHEDQNDENHQGENGQDKVVLIITGVPVPNLSVTFVVRL